MQNDRNEPVSAKQNTKGLLAASIVCWLISITLMVLYCYFTSLENFRSEQFVLQFIADRQITVNFEIFMYFARVFSYALLATFAFTAINFTARLRFSHQAESYIKLLFLRVTVTEALTFWLVVFFSSCIEYYLLFVPDHSTNILHFAQNLFGAVIALLAIRLVKLIAKFFTFLFRRKR